MRKLMNQKWGILLFSMVIEALIIGMISIAARFEGPMYHCFIIFYMELY